MARTEEEKRIKIGIVSTFPPEKCGLGICSQYLVDHLRKLEIDIVTIGSLNSNADYKVNLKSAMLCGNIKKIIKKEKIDILQIEHMPPTFGRYTLNYGIINTMNLKIPKIIALHEVRTEEKYKFSDIRAIALEKIQKALIKRADIVVVHSKLQNDYIIKRYRKKEESIKYLPLGVPLNPIKNKHEKNLLFFGMISPGKGIEHLVKAMKYLPDFKLRISGGVPDGVSTEYRQMIDKEIKDGKYNNIVTEFGWISDENKKKYFEKADALVLPFVFAPWQSGVLPEGASFGLPIIITKTGNAWEIVEEYKMGEVVEPQNPKNIADGIKKVFSDYDKYILGVKKFREERSLDNIAKEHLKFYKTLINK